MTTSRVVSAARSDTPSVRWDQGWSTSQGLRAVYSTSVGAFSDSFGVTLPARAPVALTDATVNFGPDAVAATNDDDATCTGTKAAPTAPAGKVCIYADLVGNLTNVNGTTNRRLGSSGFRIAANPVNPDTDTFLYATWAYTAP